MNEIEIGACTGLWQFHMEGLNLCIEEIKDVLMHVMGDLLGMAMAFIHAAGQWILAVSQLEFKSCVNSCGNWPYRCETRVLQMVYSKKWT